MEKLLDPTIYSRLLAILFWGIVVWRQIAAFRKLSKKAWRNGWHFAGIIICGVLGILELWLRKAGMVSIPLGLLILVSALFIFLSTTRNFNEHF